MMYMGDPSAWGLSTAESAVYPVGVAVSFVGLFIQRWKVIAGLSTTAVGMALVGLSTMPSYPLSYLVVCFEAWYITAFVRHRWRMWMSLLVIGSFTSLLWGWIRTSWGGPGSWNLEEAIIVVSLVTLLVSVSITLASMLGRETAKRNERMETLAARAELATVSERNRIAREMHDIVAHSLTVVIAQADGGRYAGRKDPEKAIEALETIAQRGRDALTQMRSLLSVLHDGSNEERETSIAPGAAGIPDLLYDAKLAGLKVDYQVEGEPQHLDEVRDLTVYRIVQESLTNVMKHAGAVDVTLLIAWGKDRVEILVDNRPGEDSLEGSGRGLTGIAERVRIHGGTAKWGPSAVFAGGWNVTATLPYGKNAAK